MNTPSHDEALRQLLRENWPTDVRTSPGFRSGVWARIDALRRQPNTWSAWLKLHLLGVGMASLASLALAVAVGAQAARTEASHDREQMVARYLGSIDPHAHTGEEPVSHAR